MSEYERIGWRILGALLAIQASVTMLAVAQAARAIKDAIDRMTGE
jgi:hypothetical protein